MIPSLSTTISVALFCGVIYNDINYVNAFVPSRSSFPIMGVNKSLMTFGATLEGRTIEGEIKPTNNFIFVKLSAALEETDGGIILAGKSKIAKTEGRVMSTGPGKTHQESGILFPMPVKEGEGVVYGKYDGTEVNYNGERHTLIRDDDILVKYSGDSLDLESSEVTSDNVLVYVDPKEEQETAGGLLLAQTSTKKKPSTGKVVKVGPGRMASNGVLMEMDAKIGDMVKFRDFAGNEVLIQDDEYSVVRMVDILAKY